LTDQVDAFVTDVRESLDNPNDREQLSQRISILDEQRPYLASFRFETCWNVARSGIEIYPLLGVLGTIFALWLAMREPASDSSATVGAIVERFGVAIDSTFAGLAMAILLMVVHSYYETLFTRFTENRRTVRDMVLQVKRELVTSSLSAEESKS
jgi:biopolymer transport protein ExbB/TolQ